MQEMIAKLIVIPSLASKTTKNLARSSAKILFARSSGKTFSYALMTVLTDRLKSFLKPIMLE